MANQRLPLFRVAATMCCVLLFVATARAAEAKAEPPKIPQPTDVHLETDDGVQLVATYYPGWIVRQGNTVEDNKEAVPIVLLHGWKGSRRDFADLAQYLHRLGHLVIVPDLRGHGGSTVQRVGRREDKLDAATLSTAQFVAISARDMSAVKKFLWQKNNDGQCNLNRLGVIGGEMGATVALNYTQYDWSQRDYGPLQMGRFVKGLVLLSPENGFRGVNVSSALKIVGAQTSISVLMLVGREESHAATESQRMFTILERYRTPPGRESPDAAANDRALWFGELPTKLQGTAILGARDLNVPRQIAGFIAKRLDEKGEVRIDGWKQLKLPHE